jgi:hypothetical protein
MRRIILVAALAVFAALQLVPVKRTNPPVESEVDAPPEVKAILRKSCWDCHSHETVWGWHTYVAPISWLAVHDVNEGREELNFSRWGALDEKGLARIAKKLPEEVGKGEMPMPIYLLVHPSARPTDAERATLSAWARSLGGAPATGRAAEEEREHGDDGGKRRHGGRD